MINIVMIINLKTKKKPDKAAMVLVFLSLIIVYSTLIYYFKDLSAGGALLSLTLTLITCILLLKFNLIPEKSEQAPENRSLQLTKWQKITLASHYIFLLGSFLNLFSSSSPNSLISPWQVVTWHFFVFFAFSLTSLFFIFKQNLLKKSLAYATLSLNIFLVLSVATIVYKIGYGFDPFVHLAAMKVIAEKGFILPKTPYYIGEYGLIISLHKLSFISLYFINKILAPLLAALIIPFMINRLFQGLKIKDRWHIFIVILISSAFIWPLFISTTPQNLSYLFLILSVYSGLSNKKPAATLIYSLAAAAIHPISGIPAIIWSAWLIFKETEFKLKHAWKKIISGTLLGAGALLIPLALFISSGASLNNIKLQLTNITESLKLIFNFSYAGSENWLLNFVYMLSNNYYLIILALILSGVYLFKSGHFSLVNDRLKFAWRGLLSINISLLIAFILSSQINFSQLISYEQSGFSRRILISITIFFSPFLVLALHWLSEKAAKLKNKSEKIILLILSLIFILSSLYLSYPRMDKYHNSRGYSTSALDIQAVEMIESKETKDYIVLANQQVSAAALKIFGFNKYKQTTSGELYFYPIPTGGELYQYYLDMVYQYPSKETMLKALDLMQVDTGYLVINIYWKDSDRIIKAAKLEADSFEVLGNNEIFIFKYQR